MTGKQVIIVEPRGVAANVFSDYLRLPLMGTLYLGTILKRAGFEVRVLNENLLGRDITLSELKADYLLLSLLTPTAERGYELAQRFKAINPGSRVIIGGIHPSFVSEEAVPYADHVVVGEGEGVIVDLLKYGSDQKIVSGSRVANLDDVPIPDFSLLAGSKKLRITPLITSRGCPFDCNFCSVTEMFGRGYRATSVDRVMEELAQAPTRQIFFYDDNFAANRKRTHALLDQMIAARVRVNWSAQVRADVTRDRELIAKMRRAGCNRVYIGFESINPATLAGMEKKQTREDVEQAIRILHEHKISIHGMFIFGSDEDTPEVFEETSSFCRENRLASVQFMILTPLPGTALFKKLEQENRLLHKMWSYYDGMHAVFQPRTLPPSELQDGMLEAYQDFYSYLNIMNDAVNIFFETAQQKVSSVFAGVTVNSLESAFIKMHARAIVKKFRWVNQEYISYLQEIRRGKASKSPA
ncbi:MAG: radical SAM protein [Proteobacteria bacterium]|nr:radical SAM protein [Pseudomonadota bacterium]